MVLTRFEFGGTGLFHALNLLEACDMALQDEFDYEWASEIMERELPVPEIQGGEFVSFFKPKGLEKFAEPLGVLKDLYICYPESAGLGEFKEKTYTIPDDTLFVYQDEYQVLVDKKVLESIT